MVEMIVARKRGIGAHSTAFAVDQFLPGRIVPKVSTASPSAASSTGQRSGGPPAG